MMNSAVALLQTLVELSPALSAQLLLILLVVKPVNRWIGSQFAYSLWLLLLIWFPLAYLLNVGMESFSQSSFNQVNSIAPIESSFVLNMESISGVLPDIKSNYDSSANEQFDFWAVATVVWLLGLALLMSTQLIRTIKLSRQVRNQLSMCASKNLDAMISKAGFPEELAIKTMNTLSAPAIYGTIQRVLLLPENFEDRFNSDQVLAILRHEYVHYSRYDNLINSLFVLCRNLLWFNPLIWIAYSRFRQDQELSCDCAALAESDMSQRNNYAKALIDSASKRTNQNSSQLTAWGENFSIRERTSLIKHHHRLSKHKLFKAPLLAILLFTGSLTSSLLRSQDASPGSEFLVDAESIPDSYLEEFRQFDQSTETALELENRSDVTIPIDSEYIAFIVDTSGSMTNTPGSWSTVYETIVGTLQAHPNLRGFQIANDMGDYLFRQFGDEWIPPTENRIATLRNALLSWRPYSNSSPVEGIAEVLNNLAQNSESLSIYIIGDDLQQELTPEIVLENIRRYNQPISSAGYIARIHTIMLPNLFEGPPRFHGSAYRFANLMRAVASSNGGSFTLLDNNDSQ